MPKPRKEKFPEEYKDRVKECSCCHEVKRFYNFYFSKRISKSGNSFYYFNPKCIACVIMAATKWEKNNSKKKNEINRKNSITYNAREFHRKNARRQRMCGWRKDWESKNKKRLRIYRNDRNAHKKHNISDDEWKMCEEYFNFSCAYCGISENDSCVKYGQKLNKDHLDNDGSNGIDNCVPACRKCNSSKWKFNLINWYNSDNPIYSLARYQRIISWMQLINKKYE